MHNMILHELQDYNYSSKILNSLPGASTNAGGGPIGCFSEPGWAEGGSAVYCTFSWYASLERVTFAVQKKK